MPSCAGCVNYGVIKPCQLRSLLSILILTAGCCLTCVSQPPAVFFDQLTTQDGLSNNNVNCIIKDKQGFLWIGTSDGLNRYDGKNFLSFYHSITGKNSLPHNDVYCLQQDELGYIWIGTFNGLCRLNPYTNEIIPISKPDRDTSSFFVISDIKQMPERGIVWVATNKGLFWVNQKENKMMPALDNSTDELPGTQFITRILFAGADSMWLSTYQGIACYNPSKGTHTTYTIPSHNSDPKTLVKSIYRDKKGKFWLGTWGRGLQHFDPVTKVFTRYLPREDLGERSDANIIYNCTQTGFPGEDSILWVAADAVGLLAFNMNTGKFTPYSAADINSKHGVAGHGYVFFQAKDEGLWIGGSKGLYRYDPHHQLFRNLSLNLNPGRHCLSEAMNVYADPVDASGQTLLVGTWSCGSYKVNTGTGKVEEFPAWMTKHTVSGSLVSAFCRDKDGILWMATTSNQLLKADEKKQVVVNVSLPEGPPKKQYPEHLLDDGNNGLWVGTRFGLYRVNKSDGSVSPIFRAGFNAPTNLSDEIQGMTYDQQKNLWFCTNLRTDHKPVVGKVLAGSNKVILYFFKNGDTASFPETSPLQGITSDKKNNIFCASWNGVVYWNANDDKPVFKRLTRNDGLCNDKIFKLHADKNDHIWIATLRGISCYDPKARTFRNYYTAQGLQQDDVANFFRNDISGELIAGYRGSIDILDPVLAVRKKNAPNIVITGLRVLNEVYADNKKFYMNKGLAALSPGQNMITVSFSALSFTDPREVKYAYRMEGVDKEWITTANDFVTYHNLPSGSRKFYVRARNAEGVWSAEDTWLEIEIAPPFYRTWWFILLAIAVAGSVVYWLYRQRIRRLEEKFRIRSTIARDLHDEIGSTLTSINILSRVSQSNLHKDKTKAEGLLQKITEQSQDMQQSMSDIIWAIKPDNDKLENMAAHMREYLSHTLEAKNIAIHFEADEQALKTSLNMEQRRDFFLIFKEAVNNAAKYAGSKAVTIHLKKEKRNIILVVADEGAGFDVTRKYSSNGLKNMQARATALKAVLTINSAPGKGTSVQLSIPTT